MLDYTTVAHFLLSMFGQAYKQVIIDINLQ